jgi:predicted lipid-binding transport protein (Tim44 family)
VWRQTFGSHSGWAQAILFAGELTRYRQLLHDNGCAPALGVAIKEERREANSPLKAKSPLKSPQKAGASPAVAPPSASKKSPKVKREQPAAPEQSAANASAGAAARPLVAARMKIEFDAEALDAAPAVAGAHAPKRVKRERGS